MEKKIKVLYIISIGAIIAFLVMQVYWLYTRYEYALRIAEIEAQSRIVATIREDMQERTDHPDTSVGGGKHESNYSMQTRVDTQGRTTRVSVLSVTRYAQRILGIKEDRALTDEEKERAGERLMEHLIKVDSLKSVFEASNAPSEGAMWSATKNAELDWLEPLDPAAIDSMLMKKGIDADVSLVITDSVVWKPWVEKHAAIFDSTVKVAVPYSELERKSVFVTYRIPSLEILSKMSGILGFAAAISLLLILCLIWQFSTIVRLNRLDAMRNGFITTMIHELKRPLTTLKMCVSGIENDTMMSAPETKKELTSETRRALDNLSSYFSKLRDITFNRTEQIPLDITVFNLRPLFDATSAATVIPSGKHVDFINRIPEDMAISADRSHILNILTNLVENAIKYSGDDVTIIAEALRHDNVTAIKVSDDGNGIAKGDIDKIFSRFYRGKSSSDGQPGMGLGLAYVRLLAEAHGGSVSVESQEGIGSEFIIIIPQ